MTTRPEYIREWALAHGETAEGAERWVRDYEEAARVVATVNAWQADKADR